MLLINEHEIQISLTDWGFILEPAPGFRLDDSNIISVINYSINKSRETGKTRFLFDQRQVVRELSFIKLIDAVEHFRSLAGSGVQYKVAFLLPQHRMHKDKGFVETLCFNRGISLQYFFDKDKAVAWLEQ